MTDREYEAIKATQAIAHQLVDKLGAAGVYGFDEIRPGSSHGGVSIIAQNGEHWNIPWTLAKAILWGPDFLPAAQEAEAKQKEIDRQEREALIERFLSDDEHFSA